MRLTHDDQRFHLLAETNRLSDRRQQRALANQLPGQSRIEASGSGSLVVPTKLLSSRNSDSGTAPRFASTVTLDVAVLGLGWSR